MAKLTSRRDLEVLRHELTAARGRCRRCVSICSGTGCVANRSQECADALAQEIARQGLEDEVELRRTGCFGFCERGPVVVVEPDDFCYLDVKPADAGEIVSKTLVDHAPVERLFYRDDSGARIRSLDQIPFYRHQTRTLLEANTAVDPTRIEDYIATGGYQALAKALFEMTPVEVVDAVKASGLRGRGGGGFPAGVKWETTRNAPGETKYVVVNADEGDPGAYMDRSLLEGNPHSILEGLIIGAYAIGAHQGYVYVRQEYPLAVTNTIAALEQARASGLLGKNILGSGFDFDVAIHRGAGAFVSGESSALMNAIEGRVGEPRSKYVHLSVKGLWECPTTLNNVETWANVPLIINRGADWFASVGTGGSKGTKVFSLTGKITNSGLVEVPMGVTLRQIVEDIGGGVRDGKQLKAVQTGGPSGGFIPESMLDVTVDFDELVRFGSMMGSGGMIVMDEDSCMVDAARFYVDFLAHESCGQCVPCREGLRQMLKILDRITQGRGVEGDLELLEELCDLLADASLCALGTSAPNPVRSALLHFRSEFEAHIREKRCPALVCKDLIHYTIDPNLCVGCLICKDECPVDAISGDLKTPHVIDQAKCTKCGNCLEVCPSRIAAVRKAAGSPHHYAPVARLAEMNRDGGHAS
jgi:NADH:ubiquinone oxidoreductase subunit F (NADH-binding)/(2Fe-2S) ferredoxin/Pyruvate/2-oxoacid:ferredoxin oxidoreductase delta subunit